MSELLLRVLELSLSEHSMHYKVSRSLFVIGARHLAKQNKAVTLQVIKNN